MALNKNRNTYTEQTFFNILVNLKQVKVRSISKQGKNRNNKKKKWKIKYLNNDYSAFSHGR